MNTEWMMWITIAIGLVPWLVSRSETPLHGKGRQTVTWELKALFWTLTATKAQRSGGGRKRGKGMVSWRLSVPLIRKISDAVWAAVRKLLD